MGRFYEVFFNWFSVSVLLICMYVCITRYAFGYYSNGALAFWISFVTHNVLIDLLHYFHDPGRIIQRKIKRGVLTK